MNSQQSLGNGVHDLQGGDCYSPELAGNPRDSQVPNTHFQDHYNCHTEGFCTWISALGFHCVLPTVAAHSGSGRASGWLERKSRHGPGPALVLSSSFLPLLVS